MRSAEAQFLLTVKSEPDASGRDPASQSGELAAITTASASARNSGRTSKDLICPFQSEGEAIDDKGFRHSCAVVARRTLCAAEKKGILKRIQKTHYLGLLEVI